MSQRSRATAPAHHHHARPLVVALHVALTGAVMLEPASADAQVQLAPSAAEAARTYDIPAGPLVTVLARFTSESGVLLAASSDQVRGRSSPGLHGRYTPVAAIAALLQGTGLEAARQSDGTFALRTASAVAAAAPPTLAEPTLPVVRVKAGSEALPGELPKVYAGGQVARGSRLGILGNQDVFDTPFNTKAYTSEFIDNQQARTVTDVIKDDPSVRASISRNGVGSEAFFIRGFNLNGDSFAFDGMYGINPFFRRTIPIESVERVELIKGPNALLNGVPPFGSVAGAINLVPKRAADEPLTRVTTNYVSDSEIGAHLDVGRRFGQDRQFGVRVNALYRDGNTSVDHQSGDFGHAAFAFDYRGEQLRATVDLGYVKQHTNGALRNFNLAPGNYNVPAAPDSKTNIHQSWEYFNNEQTYAATRIEYDAFENLTVFGAYGRSHYREASLELQPLLLNGNGDFRGNFGAGFSFNTQHFDGETAELGIRGAFATGAVKHSVTLAGTQLWIKRSFPPQGAPVGLDNVSNIFSPARIPEPANLVSARAALKPDSRFSDSHFSAIALADTLSAVDGRVLLTLGARHQNIKVQSFNLATGAPTTFYDKSKVTPAVGLVLKPMENLSIYGNYIEALQQGPTAPLTAANAGEVFAPYVTDQIELGAKLDLGSFGATLSTFSINQPSAFTNTATNVFAVDGKQRNRGVELETFGSPLKNLRLLGGAAYIDARLARTAGGVDQGNRAPGVPKYYFNLGAEWDPALLSGLTLTGRVIYTTSQYFNRANTQSIPAWTRWDFGARYAFTAAGRPTVVRATLENALDKNYWQSASLLSLGAPRTLLLSATVDF